MKRIVSIISAAAVLFSFQSCEVEPTSLSGDSLPGKVEKYNGLVSPGSDAFLYGTENIGLRLSVNYYF